MVFKANGIGVIGNDMAKTRYSRSLYGRAANINSEVCYGSVSGVTRWTKRQALCKRKKRSCRKNASPERGCGVESCGCGGIGIERRGRGLRGACGGSCGGSCGGACGGACGGERLERGNCATGNCGVKVRVSSSACSCGCDRGRSFTKTIEASSCSSCNKRESSCGCRRKSPCRTKSPSPPRCRVKSPCKERCQSPCRTKSPSPPRCQIKSPCRTKSPRGRCNTRAISRSPSCSPKIRRAKEKISSCGGECSSAFLSGNTRAVSRSCSRSRSRSRSKSPCSSISKITMGSSNFFGTDFFGKPKRRASCSRKQNPGWSEEAVEAVISQHPTSLIDSCKVRRNGMFRGNGPVDPYLHPVSYQLSQLSDQNKSEQNRYDQNRSEQKRFEQKPRLIKSVRQPVALERISTKKNVQKVEDEDLSRKMSIIKDQTKLDAMNKKANQLLNSDSVSIGRIATESNDASDNE